MLPYLGLSMLTCAGPNTSSHSCPITFASKLRKTIWLLHRVFLVACLGSFRLFWFLSLRNGL